MPSPHRFSLNTKLITAILASLIVVFTIIAAAMWIGSSRYIDQTRITITEFSRDESTRTMNVLHSVLQRKGESLTDFLSEISAIKIISFIGLVMDLTVITLSTPANKNAIANENIIILLCVIL